MHTEATLKVFNAVKAINAYWDGCKVQVYWSRRAVALKVVQSDWSLKQAGPNESE